MTPINGQWTEQHDRDLAREGGVYLTDGEFKIFFDAEALRLVGVPGEEALLSFKNGTTGTAEGWKELALLLPLLD